MRIGMLVLTSIILSGCAGKSVTSPCNISDYVEIPKGAVINDVPLPTDEGKNYNVITQKNGFWMSFECHNRMEKGK